MKCIFFVHKIIFLLVFCFLLYPTFCCGKYIQFMNIWIISYKATVICSTSYDQVSFPPLCHLMYKINVLGRGWGQPYRPHCKSAVKIMKPPHHKVSMYVWRTHTPFPFMPWLCISALDTAAVPTATGVLQKKKESALLKCFPSWIFTTNIFPKNHHDYYLYLLITQISRIQFLLYQKCFQSCACYLWAATLLPVCKNINLNSFRSGANLWHTYCPPL